MGQLSDGGLSERVIWRKSMALPSNWASILFYEMGNWIERTKTVDAHLWARGAWVDWVGIDKFLIVMPDGIEFIVSVNKKKGPKRK